MSFECHKCNVDRNFDHRDYYDFDHYVCPVCGDVFMFPADGYGEPDDYEEDFGPRLEFGEDEIECGHDGCKEMAWLVGDQGAGYRIYECPVHGSFGVQFG